MASSLRELVGDIAFGSRLSGDGLHVEDDAGERLTEIRRLRGEGATLRGIAAALNAR